MTYLGPFDDSELSRAALARAVDLASDRGHEVVAFTVLPRDREYAVERGWVDDADVVFIGSENAGRIGKPVSSVGGTVAAGDASDVDIVPSLHGPGR